MVESTIAVVSVHQMRVENYFAYLIEDAEAHEAMLVGPCADQVAAYRREVEERRLRLRFVIETHTHVEALTGDGGTCAAPIAEDGATCAAPVQRPPR